jgi:periplasmic divalent cation tolerance protein
MTANEVCEVIITASDAEWLQQFSKRLVADRLSAAAHLVPIRTVYRWKGRMHDTTESRVALHTRSSLVSEIVARTNREHSYEVPCVAAMPITDGNSEYIAWILDETLNSPTEEGCTGSNGHR